MYKQLRDFLKGIRIAFSMYSTIPMGQSDWKAEDMRMVMSGFPLIGIVLGGLAMGLAIGIQRMNWPVQVMAVGQLALMVAVTGGIHLDGLVDAADAWKSYGDHHKRREILKDPHIGGFALIYGATYLILLTAAYSLLSAQRAILLIGVYTISRITSAVGVILLPKMSDQGSVSFLAKAAAARANLLLLTIEAVGAVGTLILLGGWLSVAVVMTQLLIFLLYIRWSKRVFGGTNGDTAGALLQISELAMILLIGLWR